MTIKQTYVLKLRSGKRSSILFNVGGEGKSMTLLRLKGTNTTLIFNEVISALSRYGAISPLKTSEQEDVFTIREDLGPIIGGYLILLRRSRNPKKWLTLLNDVLEGRYPILVTAFENYLTMVLDMSRFYRIHSNNDKQILKTNILDASSSALKAFVSAILRRHS